MKAHTARIHGRASAYELESRRGPAAGERVAAFLRREHPLKTAEHVAARTGISIHTVKTLLHRGSTPNFETYTALWISYGAGFLEAVAHGRSPQWLVDLRRDLEAAELKAEIATLERKLARVRP